MEKEITEGRRGDPCVIIIFGATGDLTKRKLIPSLYNLASQNLIAKEVAVVGFGINEHSNESFREQLNKDIKTFATGDVIAELWKSFLE